MNIHPKERFYFPVSGDDVYVECEVVYFADDFEHAEHITLETLQADEYMPETAISTHTADDHSGCQYRETFYGWGNGA